MSAVTADKVVAAFAQVLVLPPLDRLVQDGRDPTTASFVFEFHDGREVKFGSSKDLASRTEFARAMAIALDTVPRMPKPSEWELHVLSLLAHGTTVVEVEGETFEDTVREWVLSYAGRATRDRAGAAVIDEPFVENGDLHIHAQALAGFVRSRLAERVEVGPLRKALRAIGFERKVINYVDGSTSSGRNTSSYYVIPRQLLED